MKRLLLGLGVLVAAALVLPPLWYVLFPYPAAPELPPPGRHVPLPGGARVHVLEQGRGPAVVLVHGLPGTAYDWRETSAALAARGRRALAYDRVGWGRSDPRPDDSYTPGAHAAELLALLRALDLRRATVVGWSYGGVVGMLAAVQDPEAVGRLVLVGTGGPDSDTAGPPEPSALMAFLYADPVLAWRSRVPPIGVGLMRASSALAFGAEPQPDWWLPGLRANFARRSTLITYREELGADLTTGTPLQPRALTIPVLIVHGSEDALAPVAIARYLAGVIPRARLIEVPGGSHMLPITRAVTLADSIVGFDAARRSP